MRVVYISGAYRSTTTWGIEQNVRAAEKQALAVWGVGLVPVCPHTMSRFFYGSVPERVVQDGLLELVRHCDAVLALPGFEQSSGSMAEVDEAVRAGIPVFESLAALVRWDDREGG